MIGGDERLIQANNKAVAAALAYVEQHLTMGRHKENGKSRVEHTGNLIIAKFRHETTRPTESAAPDPHLYVHALLMNLTHRQEKTQELSRTELHRQWRDAATAIGMQFDQAREHAGIQPTQILGQPSDLVAQASLNWAIQHLAERESVMPLADLLQSAVRHAGGHTDITAIQATIQGRVESGALNREAPHYRSTQDRLALPMTRDGWATEVTRLRGLPQGIALQLVDQAIAEGRLLMESPRYATRKAFEAESRILATEQTGRSAWQATITDTSAESSLDTRLTPGQREAVMLVATGTDQIAGIQGLAGTGKSFALQNAQAILKQQGHTMAALAPYGGMVRNLRKDGIPANTHQCLQLPTNASLSTPWGRKPS